MLTNKSLKLYIISHYLESIFVLSLEPRGYIVFLISSETADLALSPLRNWFYANVSVQWYGSCLLQGVGQSRMS